MWVSSKLVKNVYSLLLSTLLSSIQIQEDLWATNKTFVVGHQWLIGTYLDLVYSKNVSDIHTLFMLIKLIV